MEVTEQGETTTTTDVTAAQRSEAAVQRELERAKEHASVARLHDAFVLELDVVKTELTSCRLERDGVEVEIDLYERNGLDEALHRSLDMSDCEKAYLPVLVVSYAGKQRPFTPGPYSDESDAQAALPDDPQIRDELAFRFSDDSTEEIRYGLVTSIRRHLPDRIERWLNNAWLVCGLTLALPLIGLAVHPAMPLGLTVLIFCALGVLDRVEEWAGVIDDVDLETVYDQTAGEREFDVVTCGFESTAEALTVESPKHDATWTFEKNAMGELSERGKVALDSISVEGDECIVCVSRSRIDEVNELESDCGEWKLESL